VISIPFDANEDIDETALRRLIDFAVQAGVSAICLPAYGSEFYKLSDVERAGVVKIAVEQAAGKLLVMAQSNHGSSKIALSIARENIRAGADLISIAIPRMFALSDDDLLRYLQHVLNGVDVPCLIQDFNPGGATVSVDFVVRLRSECANFRYLKLEEPLAAPKVGAILEATHGEVGVLEGWGGLYMMELIPVGICGVMPGLALADILNRVFHLRKEGKAVEAFELYEKVLPQIVHSLQNMEFYLYCEKRLLEARGLLTDARRRVATYTPDAATLRYVDELNDRILGLVERFGLFGSPVTDLERNRVKVVK
jgi:4-hydroxy-tetrahydrodipicolinate synthase